MQTEVNVGVAIDAATKRYGDVVALDAVSLDVSAGEFVSLLGPSGSGKTTLLGILGGFVRPTSGFVHIGQRDVTHLPPHKREIGVVFQNYALFPHMTVGQNVAFPLRARRLPKSTWEEKINAALAMVELSGYQERHISQLSGGQRQRVALARAIVFEPRLILMDEPLSALDKQLRETMQIELRRLHKKLDATIIYVTHDQREALTMSDRVAILHDGRLVQVGTPTQLHERPADSFVAQFIGESTLLPVQRVSDREVKLGQHVLRSAHQIPPQGDILLAVQSEKLLISHQDDESNINQLSCRITDIIYQGESLKMFLAMEDGGILSLRQPSHYRARVKTPSVGDSIIVTLHPEDTIVVRKASRVLTDVTTLS